MKSNIFVIVPAYNESTVMGKVLEALCGAEYSVVVVDDGSTDDTSDVVSGFPVHRLSHMVNLGQGAAIQTGTEYALGAGAEFIVHFDADGQHRDEDIEELLRPILSGEADVTLGSRFLRRSDGLQVPPQRRMLLKLAILVNLLLTRTLLTDAHNGLRAMNRAAAGQIAIRQNRSAHATEILGEIRRHRLRVTEVPTTIRYTAYSKKKGQRGWNAVDTLFDLILRFFE